MSTDATSVLPAGYDPQAPESQRHEYASKLLEEAKGLWSSAERFVVIMATIRTHQLYKLLGHATFDALVLAEFDVSPRTGQRWIQQGNELISAKLPPHESNGLGIDRPTQPARISQREAAARQAERRPKPVVETPTPPSAEQAPPKAKAKPLATVTELRQPKTEEEPAELEAPSSGNSATSAGSISVDVVLPPSLDEWETPAPTGGRSWARRKLDVLLGFMEEIEAGDLAAVATPQERARVKRWLAGFEPKAKEDADCRHPRNRRIGARCAVCGATVKQ